jgi:hypothetical protein
MTLTAADTTRIAELFNRVSASVPDIRPQWMDHNDDVEFFDSSTFWITHQDSYMAVALIESACLELLPTIKIIKLGDGRYFGTDDDIWNPNHTTQPTRVETLLVLVEIRAANKEPARE